MACFIVPGAEAVIMTVVTKAVESKEKQEVNGKQELSVGTEKIPFSKKLKWLTNLLWGGSVLLAFEHLWHGEIVPWFPFLTAASNAADTAEMLHEMATAGVMMAVLVTAVWICMLLAAGVIEKRAVKEQTASE